MLPTPGTPDFAPLLVDALASDASLRGWAVDGTLVAVVLLALTVRRGGVIIDVPYSRRSAAAISRAAGTARAITESVFGLETDTLHLSSESTTTDVTLGGEALVITGMGLSSPPVLVKLRSELRQPNAPFVIWVRDEDRHDAPLWMLDLFACSTPLGDHDPPPDGLERNTLIPQEYIDDLCSLLRLSHIHPPLELHMSNLIAAAELHPRLFAAISQSGSGTFTALVRGQRLLASPFPLPQGWKETLDAWRRTHQPVATAGAILGVKTGFGGGPGGVETWGERAGEVPRAEAMLGPGAEDWFCTPDNVAGAWELAIRHRVRVREPGEGALYALNSSALERTEHARKRDNPESKREEARKRRLVLDEALDEILTTV